VRIRNRNFLVVNKGVVTVEIGQCDLVMILLVFAPLDERLLHELLRIDNIRQLLVRFALAFRVSKNIVSCGFAHLLRSPIVKRSYTKIVRLRRVVLVLLSVRVVGVAELFNLVCILKNFFSYNSAQRRIETLNGDRKSTRLNSSHVKISYAVFCLKKKKYRSRP